MTTCVAGAAEELIDKLQVDPARRGAMQSRTARTAQLTHGGTGATGVTG